MNKEWQRSIGHRILGLVPQRSKTIEGSAYGAQIKRKGFALRVARAASRERYQDIAEALKIEAGVLEHQQHKKISGLAWLGTGRILAPLGITRRQLYVLAHECGHIMLHSVPSAWSKPRHVLEHEAETYAHRAFRRYGVEVPEKSTRWARAYVAHCIRADRLRGVPICGMAEAFAQGVRSPYDLLPALDGPGGKAEADAGASTEPFTSNRRVGDAVTMVFNPDNLPIACGTCRYRYENRCNVHLTYHSSAWQGECRQGHSWRPRQRPLLARIVEALLDRISGRYRFDRIVQERIAPPSRDSVIRIEDKNRTNAEVAQRLRRGRT